MKIQITMEYYDKNQKTFTQCTDGQSIAAIMFELMNFEVAGITIVTVPDKTGTFHG